MGKPNPPGFVPADVMAGLRTAMKFGEPNRAGDKATFHWSVRSDAAGADEDGIPFNPTAVPQRTKRSRTVACAVEFFPAGDRTERFGVVQSSRVELTILDPEFQQVKDFEYVVWGGDKYIRRSGTVDGLGSIDVHTVLCIAEDEA